MATFFATSSAVTRVEHLPASTIQCHAANLLELLDGTLLCVWFGGTQEGIADISVYLSRRSPKGSWTDPVRVSSDATRSEQNPLLFRDTKTDTIWLFHTSQPAGNQDEAVIIARTSTDRGISWSDPRTLITNPGAFVRQPLFVLENAWVLPIWYCRTPTGFRWVGSDDVSAVLFSTDNGIHWEERLVPESVGCVHMGIVSLQDHTYASFFRSRWADHIYRSLSTDGTNWTVPVPTAMPNPNSGIGITSLPNGDLVMAFNNVCATTEMVRRLGLYDDISTPETDARASQPIQSSQNITKDGCTKTAIWGTPRRALTLALSKDGGETWRCRLLEDGDGWCLSNNSKDKANHELSYPSITAAFGTERAVHLAYTYHRLNIKYVYIDNIDTFIDGAE